MSDAAARRAARNLELALICCSSSSAGCRRSRSLVYFLFVSNRHPEVRWTLLVVVLLVWMGAASAARQLAVRSLNLIANLLGALREGDYSIRGLSARSGSSMSMVMREVNDLGSTLQRQRTEAVESTALLTHVMEEIGVAVFAFDPTNQLLLVNKAGEELIGKSSDELIGWPASALGFDEYLDRRAATADRSQRSAASAAATKSGARVFYRDGRPHHLVVLADLSQALREQEQAAWQRIVRVLSHEINNSLTPIKSIAHSLRRIVDRAPEFQRSDEVQQGLSLIEERSGALGRFLRSYAQLARLPKPNPKHGQGARDSSAGSPISKNVCPWPCSRRRTSSSSPIPIRSSSC